MYNGAGIFINNTKSIEDGIYLLSNKNNAYYLHPGDQKKYVTCAGVTGTVTITRGTLQSKDPLKTLQGTFTYTATDTLTGKKFKITNGAFLMEYK